MNHDEEDDESNNGFVVHRRVRNNNKNIKGQPPALTNRIILRNIVCKKTDNPKEEIQTLLQENAGISVDVPHITIIQPKVVSSSSPSSSPVSSCCLVAVVVELPIHTDIMDTTIQRLDGVPWNGVNVMVTRDDGDENDHHHLHKNNSKTHKKLHKVVQRRRRGGHHHSQNHQFGSKEWSKPIEFMKPTATTTTTPPPQQQPQQQKQQQLLLQSVVDNSGCAKASTVCDTTICHQNDKCISNHDYHNNNNNCNQTDDPNINKDDDFQEDDRLRQTSLSQLLLDYGEADPNWATNNVHSHHESSPPPSSFSLSSSSSSSSAVIIPQSRLATTIHNGKKAASIHVELVSFGYIHGIPNDIRNNGGCYYYAHPLPLVDCRDLPPIPPYLYKLDGLSSTVKRIVLESNVNHHCCHDDTTTTTNIKRTTTTSRPLPPFQTTITSSSSSQTATGISKQIAEDMLDALYDAMMVAGHGPASPLHVTVYCGSESGRHRSVVVCEHAATLLRRLLRTGAASHRLSYSVSVGTRHRELDRRESKKL